MTEDSAQVRRRGRSTVEVTPSPWQAEADIEQEFESSWALTNYLIDRGTESWSSRYRWWGPVKVMGYKEVGPPPWRLPRIGVNRYGRTVRVVIGWRSTAFGLLLRWQPKPRVSGSSGRADG